MDISKIPDNIKVHPIALRSIKEISLFDDKIAGRIIQRIVALALDPEPNNDECTSKIVNNLRKYKINVRRLRCLDIADYRIFYASKKSGMICIYAVVFALGRKYEIAYKKDSVHYNQIKLLSKLWKECQ